MYITAIYRSEGGKEYTVTDETRARYVISAGDFKRFGIAFSDKDDDYPIECPDNFREHFVHASDKLRCVKYLQWYITSYGEKSKKRLLEKCRENDYSADCAEDAIELLCEFSVINEVYACERRISAYAKEKLYGKYRIKQELVQKGYEKSSIDEAFENIETDFYENAALMYRKLTKNGVPADYREKKKIADKMVRYGYSFDEIKYASSVEYEE